MKTWGCCLVFLLLFACSGIQQGPGFPEVIRFETGALRGEVMAALSDVTEEEGFTLDEFNESEGLVSCKPRQMLRGILWEKTSQREWRIQSKAATQSYRVQFSAEVSPEGVVGLNVLVFRAGNVLDEDASRSLARYYEGQITQKIEQHRRQKRIKVL